MGYQTDGRRWAQNRCELNIFGPGWPTNWQRAACSAMAMWNTANPRFSFVPSPGALDRLDTFDFGASGWLAITQTQPLQPYSHLTSAVVMINTHYQWDPLPPPRWLHSDLSGAHDLETVVAHELGHVLHLDHDTSPNSRALMRSKFLPGEKVQLDAEDIKGSKQLYP